jgi:hypothetical protein
MYRCLCLQRTKLPMGLRLCLAVTANPQSSFPHVKLASSSPGEFSVSTSIYYPVSMSTPPYCNVVEILESL